MNSRNFEKFRIFLFLQGQVHSHSYSTGIKIWLPGIVFLLLSKVQIKIYIITCARHDLHVM